MAIFGLWVRPSPVNSKGMLMRNQVINKAGGLVYQRNFSGESSSLSFGDVADIVDRRTSAADVQRVSRTCRNSTRNPCYYEPSVTYRWTQFGCAGHRGGVLQNDHSAHCYRCVLALHFQCRSEVYFVPKERSSFCLHLWLRLRRRSCSKRCTRYTRTR